MRDPYDWTNAPADDDFEALSPETGVAAYKLLRACMGPASAAGDEFAEMVPVDGTDGYCVAFHMTRVPGGAFQFNAVQIRAVSAVGLNSSITTEFRERRVLLSDSLLSLVRTKAQTTVSEMLRDDVKLLLFGTRMAHPAGYMRLKMILEKEHKYFNLRAVMLCRGLHRKSKDRSVLFILSSAILGDIFRRSIAL